MQLNLKQNQKAITSRSILTGGRLPFPWFASIQFFRNISVVCKRKLAGLSPAN